MTKKYCSHCCTITTNDQCGGCNEGELKEIVITVQASKEVLNEA